MSLVADVIDTDLPRGIEHWTSDQLMNWAMESGLAKPESQRRVRVANELRGYGSIHRADPVETAPDRSVTTEAEFVDLTALDAADIVEATVGSRVDGIGLLYAGAVNGLIGDPEQGKSLVAAGLAVQVRQSGGTVVWLDLDHNGARAFRGRLDSLGAGHAAMLSGVKFAQPDDRAGVEAVVQWVIGNAVDLFVVDSLGELLPMFGASSDSSDEYTKVHRAVLTAAARAGAAVLTIDHLAKNSESRAYGGTGTIAKKRAVDGALYRVDATRAFAPGKGGEARLRLLKDRHGYVRSHSDDGREPVVARFEIEPGEVAGLPAWAFHEAKPQVDPAQADVLMLALMEPAPISQNDVRKRLGWGASRVKRAWDEWSS